MAASVVVFGKPERGLKMKKLVLVAALVTAASGASAGGFLENYGKSIENQPNLPAGVFAVVFYPTKVVTEATLGNVMSFATTGRHVEGTMAPLSGDR